MTVPNSSNGVIGKGVSSTLIAVSSYLEDLAANLAVADGGIDADHAMTVAGVDAGGLKRILKTTADNKLINGAFDETALVDKNVIVNNLEDDVLFNIKSAAVTLDYYAYVKNINFCTVTFIPGVDVLTPYGSSQNDGSSSSDIGRQYLPIGQGVSTLNGVTPASTYNASVIFQVDCRGLIWLKMSVAHTSGNYYLLGSGDPRT